jgi:formylglycine-generating enzyme required for sulfatase activity
MGQYEINQTQCRAVMGQNPSRFPGDDRLVENVSWQDVQAFIKKFNERERQSSGILCRLPTEAEWEYAARAGMTTLYSFGDDAARLDDYAWHSGNAGWDALRPPLPASPRPPQRLSWLSLPERRSQTRKNHGATLDGQGAAAWRQLAYTR